MNKKYYGSVEAYMNGIWGLICSTEWDDRDANVTCKELGYYGGVASKSFYSNMEPMVYGNFNCTGTEKSLSECPHTNLTCIRDTPEFRAAGVLCYHHIGK